ncbi:MAG: hypothetical protein HYR75_05700 [Gemmatimonadetes bacterium]|nr:hypothetical protein [Gemmatimonadota bacterium]MBI3569195.1 hypothetical protein [Gemmatimonadota bacterium]
MTVPITNRLKPQPRRLNLVLRDSTVVEGYIHIGEEQSLVQYFNTRRGGWFNLTRARRPRLDEPPGHIIAQAEHVIMASAPDEGVQVGTAAGINTEDRPVEVVLIGGHTVRGFLSAAPQQRLSDVIAASGKFVGVTRATLKDGRALGDVVLHTGAIEILRDLRATAGLDEGSSLP